MNATLRKFGYPGSTVREYRHWVVMLRPQQPTFGCVVIAAKSDGISFGDLTPRAAAELPGIMRDFEATLRRLAGAEKFNYLALMMVDPNPHFHAIPRYAGEVAFRDLAFRDEAFPKPPNLNAVQPLSGDQLEVIRAELVETWG